MNKMTCTTHISGDPDLPKEMNARKECVWAYVLQVKSYTDWRLVTFPNNVD